MAGKTSAAKEAANEAKTYEYDGVEYELSPDLDEVGLMECYEDGKIISAVKKLIGEDVYASLRKAGKLNKMDQLTVLLENAFKAMGTSQGE